VTLVRKDAGAVVAALRAGAGRDIWLFGGGSLFRSLLEARQVDIVELAVMPVLLGGGFLFSKRVPPSHGSGSPTPNLLPAE
jgi:dihydrofolate reductase